MKRLSHLTPPRGIVALVLASAAARAPCAAEEASVLRIDEAVFDWGATYKGQTVEHTFTLTNGGEEPLVVREVTSDCGCTVANADLKDRKLLPGESLDVTLRLDTSELSPGRVEKHADVLTDSEAADSKLWMTGEVRELFRVTPEKPRLEVVRDERLAGASSLHLALECQVDQTVVLKELRPLNKLVTATVREVEKGKRYAAVLAPKIDLSNRQMLHTEVLQAATIVGSEKVELRIPVQIVLRDRIDVSPARSIWFARKETAALRTDPDARPPEKVLEIASLSPPPHAFRIRTVNVEKGLFRTQLETIEEGRRYRLRIEFPRPESDAALIRDKIVVETDDPRVPTLTIPATAQY